MIEICQDIVFKRIIEVADKSFAFSLLVDETGDIAETEQVSICNPYLVQGNDGEFLILDDFL